MLAAVLAVAIAVWLLYAGPCLLPLLHFYYRRRLGPASWFVLFQPVQTCPWLRCRCCTLKGGRGWLLAVLFLRCSSLSTHPWLRCRCACLPACLQSIVAKSTQLSCHAFGCRLVQRVLEHCTITQLKERAISEVLANALQLSHDQFGNYVVQHLVTRGAPSSR